LGKVNLDKLVQKNNTINVETLFEYETKLTITAENTKTLKIYFLSIKSKDIK
jgi:hypothetical protein